MLKKLIGISLFQLFLNAFNPQPIPSMHATSKNLFFLKLRNAFIGRSKAIYLILMTISLQKLEYNKVLSKQMLIEEM